MVDFNSLKVTELKEELTKRGLSTKGVKKELVARLEEALASDGTTMDSATEPDVAPKDTDMEHSINDNNNGNASNTGQKKSTTQAEAQEIAQIAPPIAEPVAAPAVAEVVMAPAPVPAPASATQPASSIEGVEPAAAATIKPDPVEGTSMLTQEGLIDTTMSSAPSVDQPTESKKRSLESDDTSRASSSNNGASASDSKETPAKKQKSIAINREGNEHIIAAAKETLDADTRRRSAAPSPSPAPSAHPGRALSTGTIATVAEVSTPSTAGTDSEAAGSSTTGSTAGPRSPTEDKRPERRDVRSQMQRQIQLAAQDRRPDATNRSATVSPTMTSTPVVLPVPAQVEALTADANPTVKRALTITNFLRPLTIPQVRRELAQYGEIETLWLDNIKTHCYVIYKEAEEAEKACEQTNNVVFPKETGRPLKPYIITAEAARRSIDAADQAQKAGKKPVIYTGQEPTEKPKAALKPKAPIAVQKAEAGVIFKRPQVQVVQPTELFSMTKAKPMLYYKAVKAPPAPAAPEDTATTTLPAQAAEAN
ncbi:hypothetical protein BGZ95_007640 [Linnemannia exigua]|uniref:SAP domain-containing protein n=1 Tax=Linnemannia exigua TaxID=604196 RepID=A0AAD4DN55_9FUNG|nr:hypothetical protein BGZ95_007640 [Linnemannia exigua]